MKPRDIPDSLWYMMGAGVVIYFGWDQVKKLFESLIPSNTQGPAGSVKTPQTGVKVDPPGLKNLVAINSGLHAPVNTPSQADAMANIPAASTSPADLSFDPTVQAMYGP